VKRCLEALAFRFDDGLVTVDLAVHNPRGYGALRYVTRKGDHTSERPHRLSRILEAPEKLEFIEKKLLEALTEKVPVPIALILK